MKYLYLLLLLPTALFAQITVDVNSGDPAFPFPQFLAYESDNHSLGNLGTQNAPGVTHAEMEQTIKDAWQIMANRFIYEGIVSGAETTYSGVRYIKSNVGCPYDCSEGDGYALLAAAEMADKTTFDGIWFRVHDFRMIAQPRYNDCVIPDPEYRYGKYALKDNVDSAADGDFDIALALLVASKQWGENSGHTDACNKVINYKEEALNVIRGLVEKSEGDNIGDRFFASGSIGFDGYIKGGNTWNELTTWGTDEAILNPSIDGPQFSGQGVPDDGGDEEGSGREVNVAAEGIVGTIQHIDYAAPAYFHAFADFLEKEGNNDDVIWNIPQFNRGEASSDWLMGKMLDDAATLPLAGWVGLTEDNEPKYFNFLDGEDFRNPWRTVLNYVWHGNPNTSWDANDHTIQSGGNSYEKEIGERLAKFLANPGESPWSNDCNTLGGGLDLSYNGPSQLKQYYDPNTGEELGAFPLNWLAGTGSPSAIAAEDFDLMGKLYRQCVIEWDTTNDGDGYLTSVPGYFHGFFRLLGMLTLSGNHHSPAEIELESNIKVYHKLNKTFAFTGDELEFTISYRNYASVDALNVQISTVLPEGMSFISASNGGVGSGTNVSWDIGTVSGFNSTQGVEGTTGEVTLAVKVDEGFSGSFCNSFEITTGNGKGWISNEFPNEDTAVMQRNCVDIVDKALEIAKTVNHEEVNPGDVVTYTVDFENASSGGFINGGRPGVVVAYANNGHAAESQDQQIQLRLYHGADEPYIDYGNYRISMFLNDNIMTCVTGEEGCEGTSWGLDNLFYGGGDVNDVSITSETIVPGVDPEKGNWNQRVIIKFSEQLATTTPHLSRYFNDEGGRVHLGGGQPLRADWRMFSSNLGSLINWSDDWSYNPAAVDKAGGLYYPITNDWTDPNNPDIPVEVYHNEACESPSFTVDNILVEEWDGFTWRRVFGNSPVPGRETEDVLIKDVLPEGFTFVGFVDSDGVDLGVTTTVLGEPATYDEASRTITWSKSILQVKEVGSFSYKAIADFSTGECEKEDETQINTASIEAKNESPVIDEAVVNITCNPVILPPEESSMFKEVFPVSAEVGDQVEYTLAYKNEDGSSIEIPLNNASDWTAQTGSLMAINSGTLSNQATVNQVSTYDFSHGTNGSLEATIEFSENAQFGFALRHAGDQNIESGLYLLFKISSSTVKIDLYDGIVLLSSTELGSPGLATDVKVLLNEGDLNVWLGNISSPSPSWIASGLPIRAGYFGFINGSPIGGDSHRVHTVTRFYSAMDSAFNVQIIDPIPGELSFISSPEGVNTDEVVTFPMIAGPVLAGEELSYTWTAEVVSCPADLQAIENIAFTNILGVEENTIAAQAILDCSGTDLCLDVPEEPQLTEGDEIVICAGDDTEINVEDYVETTSENLELIWFDGPSKFDNEVQTPSFEEIEEKQEVTYYVAQIEDVICGEGDRIAITFNIGGDTAASTTEEITIESGERVNFNIISGLGYTAGEVQWTAEENLIIEGESTTAVINDLVTDVLTNTSDTEQKVEYSLEELSSNDCEKRIVTLIVTVTPTVCLTEAPATEDVEYCLNQGITDSLDSYVTATGTILWYADETLTSTPITMPVIDTSLSGEITYYVSQIVEGCESERTEIVVKENEGTNETVEHTEIILSNESLSFDIPTETGLSEGSFEWSTVKNLNITGQTGTVSTDAFITDTLINELRQNQQQIEYNITPFDCNEPSHVLTVIISALPSVELSSSSVLEGDEFLVELIFSRPTLAETTITLGLNPGTENGVSSDDLSLEDIEIVIPEGVEDYSFTIPTLDDNLSEQSENLEISIQSVSPENLKDFSEIVKVAIIDNDGLPSILIDDIEIPEGETRDVDIRLSNPSSDNITIIVSLVFTNETTTDRDFELLDTDSITVSFEAGETEPISQVSITAIDDNIPEGDQVLIVSVETIDNGVLNDSTDTAEIVIIDNDLNPTLSIEDVQVNEGDEVIIPVFLRTPALDRVELLVGFRDVDTDRDFDGTMQTVIFEAGSRIPMTPLVVETFEDLIPENDEDFIVFIESVVEGSLNFGGFIGLDSGIVTIQNDDFEVEIVIGDDSVEEGETLLIPVTLSNPALDVIELVVNYVNEGVTTDNDYDASQQTLTFNIGETTPVTPLEISTTDNGIEEINKEFTIAVSVNSGTVKDSRDTGTATIIDNDQVVPAISPECVIITNLVDGDLDVDLRPTIVWDDEASADGYTVSIGTTPGGTEVVDKEDVGPDIAYITPFDLEESTTYYVSVVSYNTIAGLAIGCNSISFTTEQEIIEEEEETEEEVEVLKDNKYGISPDGDGINEFWQIDDIENYPVNEVLIYNRRGSLVYRTINYDNNFNVFRGTANQQTNVGAGELKSGTYFYEIKIDEVEHDLGNLKGFLVLKR